MSGELTARDIIARALDQQQRDDEGNANYWAAPDAVLAALDAAGLEVTEKTSQCSYCGDYLDDGCPVHGSDVAEEATGPWEYNVFGHNSATPMLNEWVSEGEARGWLDPRFNRTLVRRRPAGAEEVAP